MKNKFYKMIKYNKKIQVFLLTMGTIGKMMKSEHPVKQFAC